MRWVRLHDIFFEPFGFRWQSGGFDETNGVIVGIVGLGTLRFAGFVCGQKRAREQIQRPCYRLLVLELILTVRELLGGELLIDAFPLASGFRQQSQFHAAFDVVMHQIRGHL